MSTCSYNILARYDVESRNTRPSNLDKIRSNQREVLSKSRFRSKTKQMFYNRRSLVESFRPIDVWSTASTDTTDGTWHAIHQCGEDESNSSWAQSLSPWPSRGSTPELFSDSSSGASTLSYDDYDDVLSLNDEEPIPSHFFEKPECSKIRCPQDIRKSIKSANNQSQPKNKLNPVTRETSNAFDMLRDKILIYGYQNDLESIRRIVSSSWMTLVKAVNVGLKTDLFENSISLMRTLISNALIDQSTIISMLENGLIFNISNYMSSMNEAPSEALELLMTIALTFPAAIPYMIDLMTNTNIWHYIEQNLSLGSHDDADKTMSFYHNLTNLVISQACNGSYAPLLPQSVLLNLTSEKIYNNYGPMATLNKFWKPELIADFQKLSSCSR